MTAVRVYLDHNAAAPLGPAARDAMLPWLGPPANPSSAHREGARARRAVEEARAQVAALIGAEPREIVFTSGATEANNLALRGTVAALDRAVIIVTTAIEHASVLEPARALVGTGLDLRLVPPTADGMIDASAIVATAPTGRGIASIGLANGEVGSIAPLSTVVDALRGRGILVHTDAAQAVGRIPVDVHTLGVDLLSLSSAKLGGPGGVGALWLKPGTPWRSPLAGGPQERGRRPGTENVAGIVGFGAAARVARQRAAKDSARLAWLTDTLWDALYARVPGIVRNGPPAPWRLPNTLSVTAAGCPGESLLALLDLAGVAASLGSACAAGSVEPSHVLLAMGRSPTEARSTIRLSLGYETTDEEVLRAGEIIPHVVAELRRRAAA